MTWDPSYDLQVRPVLSYVVLALNLGVYAVGIGIALTAGGEASNDYFLQLAKVNEEVLNGEYWRRDVGTLEPSVLSDASQSGA
jgi:hypothetical protein